MAVPLAAFERDALRKPTESAVADEQATLLLPTLAIEEGVVAFASADAFVVGIVPHQQQRAAAVRQPCAPLRQHSGRAWGLAPASKPAVVVFGAVSHERLAEQPVRLAEQRFGYLHLR